VPKYGHIFKPIDSWLKICSFFTILYIVKYQLLTN